MESLIAYLTTALTPERIITALVLMIVVVVEYWWLRIRSRTTPTPDTGRADRSSESGPVVNVTVINNVPGKKSVRRKRRMKRRRVRRRRRLSPHCRNDETRQEQ